MTDPSTPLKQTPLYDTHEAGGASFTDFAGWLMPVSYGSDLAEHHAVRERAGLFDISHMGEITVRGADAGDFLDTALAGRISTIDVMQAKYSLLLNAEGGILDDLIVYRLDENEFFVVANAGNREVVAKELTARAEGFDVEVSDDSDQWALLAIQGPESRSILEATPGLGDYTTPLADLRYYRATYATFQGTRVLVARTGYTGEDGFELYIPMDAAVALWNELITAGGPLGLIPAGLAARDTLRLEAGMPLYGNELGPDIRPAQVGLGRVVALSKENDFIGRSAIEGADTSTDRVLVGLVSEGRRAGRAGYSVLAGGAEGTDETVIGEVTSGALAPTLGYPIAMALVDPAYAEPGTELSLDVRGKRLPATVTALPFYKREKN